jgi:DNA-binding transcriptional MerR regulator
MAGQAAALSPPAGTWPYKMADLSRLTGAPRHAIHFYIQQGLVPPGHKTGRNTARYGEAHVERIRLVKELQADRFMPLKAIRAVIDGRDDEFTPAQRMLLVEVKHRLAATLARDPEADDHVDADALLVRHGLDRKDLAELETAGVVAIRRARGKRSVAASDAWAFEILGEVRRAGFSRKLGFDAKLFGIYSEAVTALVDRETRLLAERLEKLPPEKVASMLERAMPLVHQFFARYHAKKVREFFTTL